MNQKAGQRAATMGVLVRALEEELLGGERLTVERVAARAGVNKALVYRYFGSLNGLIAALGDSPAFMPDIQELLELAPPDLARLGARERFCACLQAYALALAARPGTVQILLRGPFLDPEVLAALHEGRTQHIAEVRRAFGGPDLAALGFDLETGFSLLLAGICVRLGEAQRGTGWHGPADSPEAAARKLCRTLEGMLLP